MTFKLPELPYAYDALEPVIDAKTMEIHHGKHHAGYTKKLNATLEETDYTEWTIEDLLAKLEELPEEIQTGVRNNGGGFYNHTLFWNTMTPGGKPMSETMKNMIEKDFGSVESFKEIFVTAASTQFGSGWAWLVTDGTTLSIIATPNQDNPLSQGVQPLLGIDIWEHAYYLHYQNKRADYIKSWFSIINREAVENNIQK